MKYIPLICCFIVLSIHFYLVNIHRLNKWKGGGFGMYSEIHYASNEVWLNEQLLSSDSLRKVDLILYKSIERLKLMPSNQNLMKTGVLIQKHNGKDNVKLQVWKPTLTNSTFRYTRELINEIVVIPE